MMGTIVLAPATLTLGCTTVSTRVKGAHPMSEPFAVEPRIGASWHQRGHDFGLGRGAGARRSLPPRPRRRTRPLRAGHDRPKTPDRGGAPRRRPRLLRRGRLRRTGLARWQRAWGS